MHLFAVSFVTATLAFVIVFTFYLSVRGIGKEYDARIPLVVMFAAVMAVWFNSGSYLDREDELDAWKTLYELNDFTPTTDSAGPAYIVSDKLYIKNHLGVIYVFTWDVGKQRASDFIEKSD